METAQEWKGNGEGKQKKMKKENKEKSYKIKK
jgi:hypothetical protein